MPSIKELRVTKGWSQMELATRAGLSITTIVNMEAGKPVQRTTMLLVTRVLEVKPEDVTGINVQNRLSA